MTSDFFSKMKDFPYGVMFLLCLIGAIGCAVLYSAAGYSWDPWAKKQLLRFMVGLVVLIAISFVNIRFWLFHAYPLYGVSLILLVAVEFMGKIGMGAQRWIDLYIFTLQPSEIMKIALLLALARYFHLSSLQETRKMGGLILPLLMVALPSILVLRQPDLGTMLILAGASFSIFFVAGLRLWKIAASATLVALLAPILWGRLHTYQKERILTFLDPERDPLGTGYHILQSKIALGSGGFFGKGWGEGSQSHLNFLPEKQTDFIFSMFCEEFGAIGGMILIFLYILLIIWGYKTSLDSKNSFGRFLGVGLTTVFFLYAFVNISMVMGILPVVGVPLPLVSYGGTALMTLLMGWGLLFCVSLHKDIRINRSH